MYAQDQEPPLGRVALRREAGPRRGRHAATELDALWAAKKAEMQSEGDEAKTPFAAIGRRAPQRAGAGRRLGDVGTAEDGAAGARQRARRLRDPPQARSRSCASAPSCSRARARSTGRRPSRSPSGRCCSKACRSGSRARTRGAAPSRSATRSSTTSARRRSTCRSRRSRPRARASTSTTRLLSEAAVLGFEYGYSVADHRTLTLWEAQFGDFMNGAQVIIDQFIAGSETKWGQPSGVDAAAAARLRRPGAGALERAHRALPRRSAPSDNMRVAYPSTPASYFHLLRFQGRDPVEKPLVVFTPKSLLRHPRCVSTLAELAEGRFEPVLDDARRRSRARAPRRAVHGQGLLRPAEGARGREARATSRSCASSGSIRSRRPSSARRSRATPRTRSSSGARRSRATWARGASCASASWTATWRAAARLARYVGRAASAAPAPGSLKVHLAEQDALVKEALG